MNAEQQNDRLDSIALLWRDAHRRLYDAQREVAHLVELVEQRRNEYRAEYERQSVEVQS